MAVQRSLGWAEVTMSKQMTGKLLNIKLCIHQYVEDYSVLIIIIKFKYKSK